MRIGVHASVFTTSKLTGIGYYALNLIKALIAIDAKNEYVLITNKPLRHDVSLRTVQRGLPFAHSYLGFPIGFRKEKCDLAFIPREVAPPFLNRPIIMTAFDLYFLKCPSEIKKQVSLFPRMHYELAARLHFKRADRILAISEDTKKDIIELCGIAPEKITVTPLGIDPTIFRIHPPDDKIKQKYGITRPYFINTSSVWWERKNLLRLIEAFSQLKQKDFQLIITGIPGTAYADMQRLIAQKNLSDRVLLLDYVLGEDIPQLLSGAIALVFPSLHEGFGLPVIEAMACGCPVITSQTSALPEAGGDAALYVDPYDVESITHAMETIQHTEVRNDLIWKGLQRAKNMHWKHTAEKTLEAF